MGDLVVQLLTRYGGLAELDKMAARSTSFGMPEEDETKEPSLADAWADTLSARSSTGRRLPLPTTLLWLMTS